MTNYNPQLPPTTGHRMGYYETHRSYILLRCPWCCHVTAPPAVSNLWQAISLPPTCQTVVQHLPWRVLQKIAEAWWLSFNTYFRLCLFLMLSPSCFNGYRCCVWGLFKQVGNQQYRMQQRWDRRSYSAKNVFFLLHYGWSKKILKTKKQFWNW